MLDIKAVRQDPDAVAAALNKRGYHFDIAAFGALDARRKQADIDSQGLLAERKSASKKIGQLVGQGVPVEEAKAQVAETLEKIAGQLDALTEQARQVQAELDELLLSVPNLPAPEVPEGESEENNVEVSRWGVPASFDFPVKDHVELGEALGQLDAETGSKITGARFTVMYGELARLHRALIQFMLNMHTQQHGYREIYVPYIVNRDSLRGTGQLPKFEEDLFCVDKDAGFYLIPTAEVPVTNLARDEILDASELPVKLTSHTPCFRSEAGSYGKDTRGMIRQHQFDKVEQVVICRADEEESRKWHRAMIGIVEDLLKSLELPHRLLQCCTGDLGPKNADMIDLECWMPGRGDEDTSGRPTGAFGETHSASRLYDYQCRRLNLRYRGESTGGKPAVAHSLNNTVIASPRVLIPILEMHQNADGSVTVPEALRPHLGGRDTIA